MRISRSSTSISQPAATVIYEPTPLVKRPGPLLKASLRPAVAQKPEPLQESILTRLHCRRAINRVSTSRASATPVPSPIASAGTVSAPKKGLQGSGASRPRYINAARAQSTFLLWGGVRYTRGGARAGASPSPAGHSPQGELHTGTRAGSPAGRRPRPLPCGPTCTYAPDRELHVAQAPARDRFCQGREGRAPVRFGLPGLGFGFGFGSVSPGQVRDRFGFTCPGLETDRFGIGLDPALKTGAMPMRNADAMAVEIQLSTNVCLMKTTGLPCCLPIARFADVDYCG